MVQDVESDIPVAEAPGVTTPVTGTPPTELTELVRKRSFYVKRGRAP